MKCIAPAHAVSPAVRVGKGIAGYSAQTSSAVRAEDQHKHPSFNPEFDHQVQVRHQSITTFLFLD